MDEQNRCQGLVQRAEERLRDAAEAVAEVRTLCAYAFDAAREAKPPPAELDQIAQLFGWGFGGKWTPGCMDRLRALADLEKAPGEKVSHLAAELSEARLAVGRFQAWQQAYQKVRDGMTAPLTGTIAQEAAERKRRGDKYYEMTIELLGFELPDLRVPRWASEAVKRRSKLNHELHALVDVGHHEAQLLCAILDTVSEHGIMLDYLPEGAKPFNSANPDESAVFRRLREAARDACDASDPDPDVRCPQ